MGSRVTIACAGTCGGNFTYIQRSNFKRKFCNGCAAARTKASKERYLQAQREERRHEQSMKAKLDAIPDFPISPYRILDIVSKDFT